MEIKIKNVGPHQVLQPVELDRKNDLYLKTEKKKKAQVLEVTNVMEDKGSFQQTVDSQGRTKIPAFKL